MGLCPAHRSGLCCISRLTDSQQRDTPHLGDLWSDSLTRSSEQRCRYVDHSETVGRFCSVLWLPTRLMKKCRLEMNLLLFAVALWKCISSKHGVKNGKGECWGIN